MQDKCPKCGTISLISTPTTWHRQISLIKVCKNNPHWNQMSFWVNVFVFEWIDSLNESGSWEEHDRALGRERKHINLWCPVRIKYEKPSFKNINNVTSIKIIWAFLFCHTWKSLLLALCSGNCIGKYQRIWQIFDNCTWYF